MQNSNRLICIFFSLIKSRKILAKERREKYKYKKLIILEPCKIYMILLHKQICWILTKDLKKINLNLFYFKEKEKGEVCSLSLFFQLHISKLFDFILFKWETRGIN